MASATSLQPHTCLHPAGQRAKSRSENSAPKVGVGSARAAPGPARLPGERTTQTQFMLRSMRPADAPEGCWAGRRRAGRAV